MARSDDRPVRRRSLYLGLALSLFLVGGWLDRSELASRELPTTERLLVVSDAGAVIVSTGPVLTLTNRDSWLLSPPRLEISEDPAETVVRTRCAGVLPCRSTLDVTVPPDTELVVVVAGGAAHIESFSGRLTVFAASREAPVTLGPISGTARVVSAGDEVEGHGLGLGELEVDVVDARVGVDFLRPPEALRITAGERAVSLRLPPDRYDVDIATPSPSVGVEVESEPGADRRIDVTSRGPVQVGSIEH